MRKRENLAVVTGSRAQPHQGNRYLQVAMAVFGNYAAEHSNLITTQKVRTMHAIFIDFVRQLFAPGHAEAHVGEEFGYAREQADTGSVMALGFLEQRFHQP